MKTTLYVRAILFCLIFIVFISCTSNKSEISDVFKEQLTSMLEEGAILGTMIDQGANYFAYRQQIAKVKEAYDLASARWPSDFAPDAMSNFKKAFEGWDLALYLWEIKINKLDNPVEPNINRYKSFTRYADDSLVIETYPPDFIVKSFRGRKYLPFDDNIAVLLNLANDFFEEGRKLILEQMP